MHNGMSTNICKQIITLTIICAACAPISIKNKNNDMRTGRIDMCLHTRLSGINGAACFIQSEILLN